MNYWNYKIKIQPRDPWVEILIAQLSEEKFDSFQEVEDGLEAYIAENNWTASIDELMKDFEVSNNLRLSFQKEVIALKNWNEEWENSFTPVVVEAFCAIKAPFHELETNCEHELTIMPKMSFGTGHHPTTFMMVKAMQQVDFKNKKVLDMGCGTGVLGILACKLQAAEVLGIDIEDWAVENAIENAQTNHCEMEFELGGKEKIPDIEYDVLLANINRNILVDQKGLYNKSLKSGGTLLLSGFLQQDKEFIKEEFENEGFDNVNTYKKENWVCLVFQKR